MSSCPFYCETSVTIPGSKEITTEVTEASLEQTVYKPYCDHPKHPVISAEKARKAMGNPLRCGGELSQCHLSQNQYDDM